MPTVLSIENNLSWSWAMIVQQLKKHLDGYEFVRITRGQFPCQNVRCGAVHMYPLDVDLQDHFNILLPQNHDGVRHLDDEFRAKTIVRFGGLFMQPNLDPSKYQNDFRSVGAVIATNDALADIARPANANVTVIPNGVPLDLFCPADPNPNFDPPFTIGFAGNTWGEGGKYKGWRYFVQAGVDMHAEGVEQLHLLHRVNQIPHDNMPKEFYHKIDALILPSQGEGCSNVVTEALACGVPVIMTKVGFHGERLTDGENVLYIERDLEGESKKTTVQIKAAVRRLMSEPDLRTRLAKNGRAFAEQYHDVRQVAALYDKVFRSILSP